MINRYRRVTVRVSVAIVVLAASAFGIWRVRHGAAELAIPVAPARGGDFSVLVHCRGSLVSGKYVELAAPLDVQDLQIVWLAPTGSEIRAGQPVIRFDPSKSQQEMREKMVALNQAQASLADLAGIHHW